MGTAIAILTVPGILALTNLLKDLGLGGKWSALAAVVLGVGLSVAHFYLADYGAWQAAEGGLILGLAAAGLYDLNQTKRDSAATS